MQQATIIYLTNIVIISILASMISHYWLREGRAPAMFFWMIGAWTLVVADVFFAARPMLPHWAGRIVPTLLVTVGHAGLLLGARKTAQLKTCWTGAGLAVGLHGAGLVYFFLAAGDHEWRMVFNALVWAGFSFASCWSLYRAPRPFHHSLFSPCKAFFWHGVFHCFRLGFASLCAVRDWDQAAGALQVVSDFEVSFFMVALFVSLLTANLRLRNEELTDAMAEVQTLTGLLPICAWCKKVRNDDGYWQRVEDYLSAHSRIKFTHGICSDCYDKERSGRRECSRTT